MDHPVFANQYLTCVLDDSVPVLKHRWLCAPPGGEFQKGLLAILEEYKKLKTIYPNLMWLADTELLGELSEEDEGWLTREWDHLLFDEAGVKVHAVILGPDFFADYPMEKFKSSSEKKFQQLGAQLEVFLDEKGAYQWLRDIKQQEAGSDDQEKA